MKKKLDKKSLLHLKKIIKFNKLRALKMCLEFGGHISSSFSTAEIITYLYSMNIINKKNKSIHIKQRAWSSLLLFIISNAKIFSRKVVIF